MQGQLQLWDVFTCLMAAFQKGAEAADRQQGFGRTLQPGHIPKKESCFCGHCSWDMKACIMPPATRTATGGRQEAPHANWESVKWSQIPVH